MEVPGLRFHRFVESPLAAPGHVFSDICEFQIVAQTVARIISRTVAQESLSLWLLDSMTFASHALELKRNHIIMNPPIRFG